MTANEYQEKAMATLNPALSRKDVLINSVMGLCGESGEAIDLVKNGWHRGTSLTGRTLQKSLATWHGIWPRRRPRLIWIWTIFCSRILIN